MKTRRKKNSWRGGGGGEEQGCVGKDDLFEREDEDNGTSFCTAASVVSVFSLAEVERREAIPVEREESVAVGRNSFS